MLSMLDGEYIIDVGHLLDLILKLYIFLTFKEFSGNF